VGIDYSQYDLADFLNQVKDLPYLDIRSAAEQTVDRVEAISFGRKGAVKARQQGSTRFAQELKEFLFYLNTGTKPFTVSGRNWHLYRIILVALVGRGEIKHNWLDAYDQCP
jgi:hypothetical protein